MYPGVKVLLLCSIISLLLILEAHSGKVVQLFQFETISKSTCANLVHLQEKVLRVESCLPDGGVNHEDFKWGTTILTRRFVFYVDVVVGMQRV